MANGSPPENGSKDALLVGVGKLLLPLCLHVTTSLNKTHHKHDNALPKMGPIEKTGKGPSQMDYRVELVAILKNKKHFNGLCPLMLTLKIQNLHK